MMKKYILNPVSMFFLGIILGTVGKLADIYTQNLGNILSQTSIWILFGILISIYSKTKKEAMLNILPFCFGMLIAYYFTAYITNKIYSISFIIGWTVFAFLSPLFAYFTWMTKQKGIFPKIISVGIVLVSISSLIILFDSIRIYDLIINAIMIYFLFFKKVERNV